MIYIEKAAVVPSAEVGHKQFNTLQAKFALVGRELTITTRASDDKPMYVVSRWGDSRCFGHLHDVKAHLNALEGSTRAVPALRAGKVGGQ